MAEVSDGYARNYLLPRGIAIEATADNINAMKISDAAKQRRIEIEKQEAVALKEKVEGIKVKIIGKAGTGGRLFGSITSKEISEALKEQFSIDIAKNKMVLEDSIKSFGTFSVKVKLYPGVVGKLSVMVCEE